MQPDRVHCSTGLLESPSAGCCVIRRWIRTLTCAQPAHGLPVPSSARSWQTLHTSLSVCLRRKLRLIVATMSSHDRLEKKCWRHRLPESEIYNRDATSECEEKSTRYTGDCPRSRQRGQSGELTRRHGQGKSGRPNLYFPEWSWAGSTVPQTEHEAR